MKKVLILILFIMIPLLPGCKKVTPEEELMNDLQRIIEKAYGEKTK